jgi:hypothetical protein
VPLTAHDAWCLEDVIDTLAKAGTICWADKSYCGAVGMLRVPYWGRPHGRQAVSRSHAKIRVLVEQAVATHKSWRRLRKLRRSAAREWTGGHRCR